MYKVEKIVMCNDDAHVLKTRAVYKRMLILVVFVITLFVGAMFYNTIGAVRNDKILLSIGVGKSNDNFSYEMDDVIIGPDDFDIDEQRIYVLDTAGEKVLVYDLNGTWVLNIDYSDLNEYIQQIKVLDTEVILVSNDGIEYTYDSEGRYISKAQSEDTIDYKNIFFEYDTWRPDSCPTLLYADILSEENDRQVYLTNEVLDDKNAYGSELRINWVEDDELVCSKVLNVENSYYYPPFAVEYVNDEAYYMRCFEDRLEIVKVKKDDSIDISKFDYNDIIHGFCRDECNDEDDDDYVESMNTYVSVSRGVAFNTAYAYANYQWYLRQVNRVGGINITIPAWIQNATNVPKNVNGIPYCYGGYMTLSDFVNYVGNTYNYQAGNVNLSAPGYVAGTAGVDCSGYASMVYGLGNHCGTWGFYSGGYTTVTWVQLCKMDFILKINGYANSSGHTASGSHIMLMHQKVNSTSFAIYDSSAASTTGKVLRRILSQTQMVNEGYTPYRAFSTEHTPDSTWSYDSNYHYHKCSESCNNGYFTHYNHNYIYSGNVKTCRVCGYTTSV